MTIHFADLKRFQIVVVIVEKDWLFDMMKADGISDPQYYLENEYNGDDSMEWFTQAAALGKIAALVF